MNVKHPTPAELAGLNVVLNHFGAVLDDLWSDGENGDENRLRDAETSTAALEGLSKNAMAPTRRAPRFLCAPGHRRRSGAATPRRWGGSRPARASGSGASAPWV